MESGYYWIKLSVGLKCLMPISARIIMVKLAGKPFDLNIIQVYMPTTSHDNEEVDNVYEQIEKLLAQTKTNEVLIVLGDMNAKVGRVKDPAKSVHGDRNERDDHLVQFCRENDVHCEHSI